MSYKTITSDFLSTEVHKTKVHGAKPMKMQVKQLKICGHGTFQ